MKKLLGFLICLLCICGQATLAQNIEGQIIASQYQYLVPGFTPNTYSWPSSTCNASGPQKKFAFSAPPSGLPTPVTIVDGNPAMTETVTPTAVMDTNQTCAISIAPVNNHQLPFSVVSGSGGLQEAINLNFTNPQTNTIILDNQWYQNIAAIHANPASVIAAAKGSTALSLEDVTQAPNTYYVWNGSQYVLQTIAGNSLTTYNTPGLQGGGKCYVYPSSITTDVAAAFNACTTFFIAQSFTAGTIDATALGSANYAFSTPLTALNNGVKVSLVKNPSTTFTINTVFSSPTNSPASCAVPVGQGSSIIDAGSSTSTPNFFIGDAFVGWAGICNGDFTGAQNNMRIQGVNVQGNPAATVSGALWDIKGLFNGTPSIEYSGTSQCNAQCVEIDSATTGSAGTGNLLLLNDQWTDGATTGTYPGSVVGIDAVNSTGEIANITFLGGSIKFNGPHNPLITINGRSGVQANTIAFLNTGFVTAPATTSAFNSNVDPVQIVDTAQVYMSAFHLQGLTDSAAQANAIDISSTVPGQNFGISINDPSVFTAAGFTRIINNTAEGTAETGYPNGNGDTVLPNYFYGQVVPQVRLTNVAPPSTVGVCIVGSTWYNSSGTTPGTVAFVCAGTPGAQTYQAFGGGGGGGGGPLGTLPYDLPTNNASNTAAVDSFNFQATGLNTPQSAVNAAATNHGTVTIQPAAGRAVFANTGNVHVTDNRTDVPADARHAGEWGAACDARVVYGTLAATSSTLTITSGTLSTNDVGRVIVAVGSVSGLPTAFESKILTFTDSLHAVLTTASPFNQSTSHAIIVGHDDTAAIAQGMAAVGSGGTLVFPGGTCLMHTETLKGQSPVGIGPASQIETFPGEDGFAAPDPSLTTGVSQGAAHIHDLTFLVDNRIDATLPWQIVNDSGTTAKAAMYRPVGQLTGIGEDPLAPGWFQGAGPNNSGAINGVCAINSGSPTLCTVPAGPPLPVATNKIVFPYLSTVFTTTVASVNTGTRVVTLTAPYPGTTISQAEWFAGTSVQTLGANYSVTGCPATMTLTNPITPVPGFESNVAPFGLVQVDAEQLTYFGRTTAAAPSTYTLSITGCAQNGTSRAAHTSGATIVPLNQYQPTYPWPVTPTINSGTTTPANAQQYPAYNVGNAGFAFPVASEASLSGNLGAWGPGSKIENLSFFYWPNDINGVAWQEVNHTADFYFAQPSYATKFFNISTLYLFFGAAFGPPSIQNGNFFSQQPTGDGSSWDQMAIWAANPFIINVGNQNGFHNFNVYSNEGTTSGIGVGADTCFIFGQEWDAQTGGVTQALSIDTMSNLYCEPEGGAHAAVMPHWEFDTYNSTISGMHMGGQGEVYIGGGQQHFQGGNFNQSAQAPAINFGVLNTADLVSGLGSEPKGNVYGTNALINFGFGSKFSGQTSQLDGSFTGPYGALQVGNNREPIPSQTNECFNGGNTAACYPSSAGGFILPEEFNTSFSLETAPMSQGWTFDSTSPITNSYTACSVGTNATVIYCGTAFFNDEGISIGPGQRLVPGKYTLWISMKDAVQATNTENMIVYSNCGSVSSAFTIPITNAWPTTPFSTQIDLTGGGGNGCFIGLKFEGATTADSLQVGYFDFAPVSQQPTDFNLNLLNALLLKGAAGTTGQGPVVQSDGSMGWGSGMGLGGLTGDVTATGTGTVAASVKTFGGGTLFSSFTGLIQNTAGVASQATSFNLTGQGQVGTYLRSGVNTVAFSATPTFDLSLGDTQLITLTGNVTSSTFSNPPGVGFKQRVDFLVCQDGTGGRTFVWPTAFQGATPVTQVASGGNPSCTSEFFNVTTSASLGTTITSDNYNGENCISSASPAVCDQATQGEVAIPTGTNPTLQINTAAWAAHSKLVFTPDQTKASDLGITCNTALPAGRYEVTGGSAGVDVILTWVGTIATNALCGTYLVVNP